MFFVFLILAFSGVLPNFEGRKCARSLISKNVLLKLEGKTTKKIPFSARFTWLSVVRTTVSSFDKSTFMILV